MLQQAVLIVVVNLAVYGVIVLFEQLFRKKAK